VIIAQGDNMAPYIQRFPLNPCRLGYNAARLGKVTASRHGMPISCTALTVVVVLFCRAQCAGTDELGDTPCRASIITTLSATVSSSLRRSTLKPPSKSPRACAGVQEVAASAFAIGPVPDGDALRVLVVWLGNGCSWHAWTA
jgi:hypothetical protein